MGGKDWIDLAHNKEKWRALVHEVMIVQISEDRRNFLTA